MFAAGLLAFVVAYLCDVHVQGPKPDGLRSSWFVVVLGCLGMALMLVSVLVLVWRAMP